MNFLICITIFAGNPVGDFQAIQINNTWLYSVYYLRDCMGSSPSCPADLHFTQVKILDTSHVNDTLLFVVQFRHWGGADKFKDTTFQKQGKYYNGRIGATYALDDIEYFYGYSYYDSLAYEKYELNNLEHTEYVNPIYVNNNKLMGRYEFQDNEQNTSYPIGYSHIDRIRAQNIGLVEYRLKSYYNITYGMFQLDTVCARLLTFNNISINTIEPNYLSVNSNWDIVQSRKNSNQNQSNSFYNILGQQIGIDNNLLPSHIKKSKSGDRLIIDSPKSNKN